MRLHFQAELIQVLHDARVDRASEVGVLVSHEAGFSADGEVRILDWFGYQSWTRRKSKNKKWREDMYDEEIPSRRPQRRRRRSL